MTDMHIPDEWSEPDGSRGVELSIGESIALWHFMQRGDVPAYWTEPFIASLVEKLKTFHKYGPWESESTTGGERQ